MPGRLLIVDDMPDTRESVRLQLADAYFEVIEATSGEEAIRIAENEEIDLVLLDVLLPGIDGFETCKRLKSNPGTAHIPVIMLSALNQKVSKITGLESGADHFVSKPCDFASLVVRLNSLTRMKMAIDELRLRHAANAGLGCVSGSDQQTARGYHEASVLVIAPDPEACAQYERRIRAMLGCRVEVVSRFEDIQPACDRAEHDLFLIAGSGPGIDPVRVAARLRGSPRTRHAALMTVFDGETVDRAHLALDLGISDYVTAPVDFAELIARLKVQIRRKFYSDQLRHSVEDSLAQAMTDPLTGLSNRRFVNEHIQSMIDLHSHQGGGLAAMTLDLDRFKQINDTWGHDTGDAVLKEFADRLRQNLRSIDLIARTGGEEFLVLVPSVPHMQAKMVAERLRHAIEASAFRIGPHTIRVTVSIGLAIHLEGETAAEVLARADRALYRSKDQGRNVVTFAAA